MNFLMISQNGFWLSVVGLAGALAMLQVLRVRYRTVSVVTNMFWQQIMVEAPARAFWQRFRHLWAYLLSLLIVLLLFLIFADPQKTDDAVNQEQQVFLLDGSAVMSTGKRFSSAVDLLLEDLERIPKHARRVLLVGAQIRPILVPGEDLEVLKKRLKDMAPETAPSKLQDQLLHLGKISANNRLLVTVYGDSPVSAEVMAMLPSAVTVRRAQERQEIADNIGIAEVGISQATSGVWGLVDIYFRLNGSAGKSLQADQFRLTVNGQALDQAVTTSGEARFLVKDIEADGGLFEIALTGRDELSIDNVTRMRLPLIEPLRVRLSENLHDRLKTYLAADPGIVLVDKSPDVVIRTSADALESTGDANHLVFAPMIPGKSAFEILTPQDVDDDALRVLIGTLGLDQIDASTMAQSGEQAIGVEIRNADQRSITLWLELLDEPFNFKKSRAFPLFMAQTIRWLSAAEPWYPYVAAGEALPLDMNAEAALLTDKDGAAYDSLDARQSPSVAGGVSTTKTELWASLQRPVIDSSFEDALPVQLRSVEEASTPFNWMTWLLLLVMGLVFIEWRLHQTGRMP